MSLGLEIHIEQTGLDESCATYSFYQVGQGPGRLMISRQTGEVTLLEAAPNETASNDIFLRAASKLTRHWRNGELPERTFWAS